MSDHSNGADFFKGFLFGGIVGAVFSLLYAPKSGKEMREDLRKVSQDLQGDAEVTLELAQKKAEILMEETKKQFEELRKEAEAAVGELKNSAVSKVQDGKELVEKEKSRIKDALEAGVTAYKKEKTAKNKKA